MTIAEKSPATGHVPAVSVLVTTYNRSALLQRSLASILQQDFRDFEIVVVDDQSSDDTSHVMTRYDDPRIRYIRNAENMARKGGDRSIFERFVNEQARGEFFLWLCDDDYWIPSDLLSRQVEIMRTHRRIAMVIGGMAQLYPTPVSLPIPNQSYISYEYVGDRRDVTIARNVFPNGFLSSETFLGLFADDPANRNNVTGATMFRAASFRMADTFAHGKKVRWQSGYLMIAGTATVGDVWYIDEPCVVATVDLDSASYRGSQLDHMLDCMRSIDAAFHTTVNGIDTSKAAQMTGFRAKMLHSTFQTYLANKFSYRLGWFKTNSLEGIERIFNPEITSKQFLSALSTYNVPSSMKNKLVIAMAALPSSILRLFQDILVGRCKAPSDWWKRLLRFPTDESDTQHA